jgi:hypothetical protein
MTIQTAVTLVKELGPLAQFEAECCVDHQPVARGRLMLSRQISAGN